MAKNCNSSIHHGEEGGNFKFRVIVKLLIALLQGEFNVELKNAIDSFIINRKTKVTTILAMVRRPKIVIRQSTMAKRVVILNLELL